jgi:DNA ligase-associated metallophosphoesterase
MPEIIEKHIICAQEQLVLTNQRAIFWERENILIVADMHLGKTAHFRQHGIAIPSSVLLRDLERLNMLIRHFNVQRLVVAGDMFHATFNSDLHLFYDWRQQYPGILIHLVKGNHDRLPGYQYRELGVDFDTQELRVSPFCFVHEMPGYPTKDFTISGHRHPGRTIHGKSRQAIRLPCFIVGQEQIVLPAFSLFTGLDTRVPEWPHTCYMMSGEGIFEVQ